MTSWKVSTLLAVVLSLFFPKCQPSEEVGSSQDMAKAVSAFRKNDYDAAIKRFEPIFEKNPENEDVAAYLAQAYASRAGVVIGDRLASFQNTKKSDEPAKKESVEEFLSFIPDEGVKETDLIKAWEVYKKVHTLPHVDPSKSATNYFFYKGLYFVFLAKKLFLKVKAIDSQPIPLKKVQALLSLIAEKPVGLLNAELIELVAIINKMPPITQKVIKDKIKKANLAFAYRNFNIEIDILSIGPGYFEGLLRSVVQEELSAIPSEVLAALQGLGVDKDTITSVLSAIVLEAKKPSEAAMPGIDSLLDSLPKEQGGEVNTNAFLEKIYTLGSKVKK